MEKEIIETVLTEMLDELKHLKKLSTDNKNVATENANRLAAIEKKVESKHVVKSEINTHPMEQLLFSGLERINKTIEEKPAAVRREFRILLFPECHTNEYFRTVFGRILFWLVMLIIARYLYLLGIAYIAAH